MDFSENEKSLKFKMAKTVLANPIEGSEGDRLKHQAEPPMKPFGRKQTIPRDYHRKYVLRYLCMFKEWKEKKIMLLVEYLLLY